MQKKELRYWWEHGNKKKKKINQLDEKCLLINFCSKVLWLSELLKYMERQILLDQNIGKMEQIVNSSIVMEEGKCQKNILAGEGALRIY